MNEYFKLSIILLVLIIIQRTLIWLLALTAYDITPDIVLIAVVYFGIRSGKLAGSISGFLSGLVLDIFSFSFLGLTALSKSTAGFIAGYFNNENKIDRYTNSYIFMIIVLACSLFNNMIYFAIYFQGTSLTFSEILLRYIIPTAVYTSTFSVVPVVFARKKLFFR
jgi:rod shape-determining protein MreD